MDNFSAIQTKLEAFIKRYYINELLKGSILFFAIGLLYFIFTLFLEHLFWLKTTYRTLLFWLFIVVELGLLIAFICIPLAKLFKLQKGIDYTLASKLIGDHFPEVSDKLLNVLQLNESNTKSELLLASIDQKAKALNPIPFKLAINFKRNFRYLKYALIPIIILLFSFFTGNIEWFSNSYTRVVHYDTAYEPPAPFKFFILNDNLHATENTDFKLFVKTAGDFIPDNVEIVFNDETYFLQQKSIGEFEYVFSQPKVDLSFQLRSNSVLSKPYTLKVLKTPGLLDFEIGLQYPSHVKKPNEILTNTGNALVPEGTVVSWRLNAKSTDMVHLYGLDTLLLTPSSTQSFEASKQVFNNFNYTLSLSNSYLKNYENLDFTINVVKDEYPKIDIQVKTDTLDLQSLYFYGKISDDYGFKNLQMVYYPYNDALDRNIIDIPFTHSNFSEFIAAFPNNIKVKEGIPYELFFQVSDNDIINKFKKTKSSVFTYRKRTPDEESKKQLNEQRETIEDLNKSLEKLDTQEISLEQLTKTQKEKPELNFNDKKKREAFFKDQKKQNALMENFNKKLKDNLEEFLKEDSKPDPFKEDLKKRLEDQSKELKKDDKLLEEIEKLQDKIKNEDLIQKLEDLKKQNKSKKRSLEQLLELTKRFYVEKKLEKLKEDLDRLSKAQEKLSKVDAKENTKEKQEVLNKAFEEFKEEVNKLEKDSKALDKPIDIPRDKLEEQQITKEQQKAADALDQQEKKEDGEKDANTTKPNTPPNTKAQKSQKTAADAMKQLSAKMNSAIQSQQGEQMQEDVEMLRQVLDNLVLFSLEQEQLMNQFKAIVPNHNKYASYLKKQNDLESHFEHIDDSLFSLSLRQPKLSEIVNKEITEVYYNIDKSLELLSENQIYQGTSKQQFAITASNNLSDFLSNTLDAMQESLSMSGGKSDGAEGQLPDIIKGQESINQKMEKGIDKGKEGQAPGEGKQKGESPGKESGEGKQGESDKEGKGSKQDGEGSGKNGKGKATDKGNEPKNPGEGTTGEGDYGKPNEDLDGLLFEIYQQQQALRQQLEDRFAKEGFSGNAKGLLKQMEAIELDLLNKGFTNQTLSKMKSLKHQLLKLENATLQQGKEQKRKSTTNTSMFDVYKVNQIPTAKQYFQTTEILNRQALPLQPSYKTKVKEYFKGFE